MKKPTILVVDDEQFFRALYAELLSDDDYLIETVSSGGEAVARLQQGGVDVVLSDLVMPGSSGMDVLRLARSLDNPADVILITGHATIETAIEALKNGARDYLVKPFKPEELQHLVRTCIEQRRLLDENSVLKSQIRLFQRGQNLASLLEIKQLLPQATHTLAHELGQGRGFAFLSNGDESAKQFFSYDNFEEQHASVIAGALKKIRPKQEEMVSLSVAELEINEELPTEANSICYFPLFADHKPKGGIVILNPENGSFPLPFPHESLFFLYEQTLLAFENAARYQGARDLIYTDDLTGLYNYRYMQIVLDQEIRRTERYGLSFSLVFIDLDHFKEINDTYGHLAGSSALREVADLLRKSVREVDLLFRYGGDEFTALLVETDNRGAAVVAERIRRTIEQHTFLIDFDSPSRLTATVGFSCYPENATDKQQIIDLADRAMYVGKKERNVVRGAGELKLR
ncbi:MAG: diguanylate cyclase response regulator [Desulfuromonas sp.]|nr:MAG: diguanylate cyclase response regulator [Desulfuromonas sp.]